MPSRWVSLNSYGTLICTGVIYLFKHFFHILVASRYWDACLVVKLLLMSRILPLKFRIIHFSLFKSVDSSKSSWIVNTFHTNAVNFIKQLLHFIRRTLLIIKTLILSCFIKETIRKLDKMWRLENKSAQNEHDLQLFWEEPLKWSTLDIQKIAKWSLYLRKNGL